MMRLPELAAQVITVVAPQELELLPQVTDAWLRGSLGATRTGRWLGGSIGIGLDPQVMTLLIYPLLTSAFAPILEKQATRWGRLARLRKRRRPQPEIPPLSLGQIEEIRQACYRSAVQAKLPKEKANLLADAVSGSLIRHHDVHQGPGGATP